MNGSGIGMLGNLARGNVGGGGPGQALIQGKLMGLALKEFREYRKQQKASQKMKEDLQEMTMQEKAQAYNKQVKQEAFFRQMGQMMQPTGAMPGQQPMGQAPMGMPQMMGIPGFEALTPGQMGQAQELITPPGQQLKPSDYQLLQNTKTGQLQYFPKGGPVPPGWSTPKSMMEISRAPAASEREALKETRVSTDSLQNLKKLFKSKYVGPLRGRIGKVREIFGKGTQEEFEFRAATYAFTNSIIKMITGAQMSEAEAGRIKGQIPQPNDPPPVWLAKWNQSMRNVKSLEKRQKEIFKQFGLKGPGTATDIDTRMGTMSTEELLTIVGGVGR